MNYHKITKIVIFVKYPILTKFECITYLISTYQYYKFFYKFVCDINCRLYSLIILFLHRYYTRFTEYYVCYIMLSKNIVNVQTLYIIGISKIINI